MSTRTNLIPLIDIPGPFNCDGTNFLLEEYLDDELAPQLKERVQMHLESCDICREMHAQALFLRNVASELAARPMPTEVGVRLRARLRESVGFNPRKHLTLVR